MNSRALREEQPPSFDTIQRLQVDAPPPAPSAPDLSHLAPLDHHLEGVLPVAPPPFDQAQSHAQMPPPPSFETVEQHIQQQEQQQG